jgi:hypothetical protein
MKTLCLSILMFFLSGPARADGLPFDPETQRVTVASLRLKLAPDQVKEISAQGTMTFHEDQLELIRLHYPAATSRTDVLAATYNDNVEGGTDGVYCFWVAPDEVALTLVRDHPRDKSPFSETHNATFPTDEELKQDATRHIRLGPDGGIFHRGRAITLSEAYRLIDEIAAFPEPDPNHPHRPILRVLRVTIPPPRTKNETDHHIGQGLLTPTAIFEALAVYGRSKSIGVNQDW